MGVFVYDVSVSVGMSWVVGISVIVGVSVSVDVGMSVSVNMGVHGCGYRCECGCGWV